MILQFYGKLEPRTRAEYSDAARRFAQQLLDVPQVRSVYQAGTVRQPGISDLDILVVLKDTPHGFDWKKHSITQLAQDGQYLFMHEPFVTSESQASQTRNLYPFGAMKKMGGKSIAFEKRDPEDELPFITQEAVLGYLFWPHRVLQSGRVNWRSILPQLSATKYEYESFRRACGPLKNPMEARIKALVEKTEHIREDVFEKPLTHWERPVAALIQEAKNLHDAMLQGVWKQLKKSGVRGTNGPYTGFFPRTVWFGGSAFREGRLVRRLPAEFAVLTSRRPAEQIPDRDVREAFLRRMDRVAGYERFVFSNRLQRFMMLTQLHTRRWP